MLFSFFCSGWAISPANFGDARLYHQELLPFAVSAVSQCTYRWTASASWMFPFPALAALISGPIILQDMSNASMYWKNNDCEFIDRSQIPIMGYSIRTDRWRYALG